jgi:hypothetical protein
MVGPGHDLEKIAIDPRGCRNAICGSGVGTVRMQVIKIFAMPDDLKKLRKRVAAFRTPGCLTPFLSRECGPFGLQVVGLLFALRHQGTLHVAEKLIQIR